MSRRPVPYDADAEASLLGAMLLSRSAIDSVCETVLAGDFYTSAHQAVYAAIVSMRSKGIPVDPVTVAAELTNEGLLEQAGGPSALITLQACTPATSSAAKYGQIILELSTLRKMINAGNEIAELGYSRPGDVSAAVESARVMLADVENASIPTEPDDWAVEEFVNRPRESVGQWVIHGLLRRCHKMLMVGGEGGSKSSIGRFVTVCAAYGVQPWRHERIKPMRTLIVDAENPADALFDSFVPILKQAQAHSGIDVAEITNRLWWKPEGINLRNRADVARLENVIRARRPDVVFAGPLYAMYENDSKDFGWETAAKQVQRALKTLMVRYNFGLIIEDHAPNDREGGMRPYGSSLWRRWPDIGLRLEPIALPGDDKHFYEDRFAINHWRGKRVEVDWPRFAIRGNSVGSKWYFDGHWGDKMPPEWTGGQSTPHAHPQQPRRYRADTDEEF